MAQLIHASAITGKKYLVAQTALSSIGDGVTQDGSTPEYVTQLFEIDDVIAGDYPQDSYYAPTTPATSWVGPYSFEEAEDQLVTCITPDAVVDSSDDALPSPIEAIKTVVAQLPKIDISILTFAEELQFRQAAAILNLLPATGTTDAAFEDFVVNTTITIRGTTHGKSTDVVLPFDAAVCAGLTAFAETLLTEI